MEFSEFFELEICMTLCQIMEIIDGQISNLDSFQKVIFYSLRSVGQLHNFALIVREKLKKAISLPKSQQ